MAEQKSKNDIAWEQLFHEHNILDNIEASGVYRISAAAINQKREARLMTKFDHVVNLPKIFAQNNLAILPDSRSSYVIGRFDCYAKIPAAANLPVVEKEFPTWIHSLSPDNLYSESAVLMCAQHAGLLADALGLRSNLAFTVFGRMGTGRFDFSILSADPQTRRKTPFRLSVDRAQCEIDGGFEGEEAFVILEVKNEEVTDFHVRQLYYPYRHWLDKFNKPVIPVFLTYSNEIFSFNVYNFERYDDYNSLQLVKRSRYQIVPTEIEIEEIYALLARTQPTATEPENVPFPQADRFVRVIDLLGRLYAAGGTLTQEEITTNYAFDSRQTQYYTNAGRYLGLLDSTREAEGISYSLTPLGQQIMAKVPRSRNLDLVELICDHRVFRAALEYYLKYAQPPSRAKVIEMMREANLNVNETTAQRRAYTVLGWVSWIVELGRRRLPL